MPEGNAEVPDEVANQAQGTYNSRMTAEIGLREPLILQITEEEEGLDSHISFEGFSRNQEYFYRELINDIGMPTEAVDKFVQKYNKLTDAIRGRVTLGHYNYLKREVGAYKELEAFPVRAQLGTQTHEFGHAADPKHEGTIVAWTGKNPTREEESRGLEERDAAQMHAEAIALQTDKTRVYLNNYHKILHKQMIAGDLSHESFVRETHAIMIELRIANPKHLHQVENAQKESLIRRTKGGEQGLPEFTEIKSGVDRTLIHLIGRNNNSVVDVESLDEHIQKLHAKYPEPEKAAA